ncbi:PAS domain S-box protein [Pseudorhodoferax soli]|uniref:Virulence sensor protein BvgS n=1 Tax=Pseudorhodoferax soli TaxID=545864 RepID=A0A368X843_9BURK|nr:PAS domain S-box protein [Pseudorhodoferax soli]RCW63869.1 PAS domain S-box-containing protein [Pseudorhodoferax soli]
MPAASVPASGGPPWRPLGQGATWAAVAACLVLAVLVGWVVQQRQSERLQQEVQRDADQLVDQVHALSSDGRAMGGVQLLGLVDIHIRQLLEGETTAQDAELQAMLAAVIGEYGADNALVLDRHGRTVAYRAQDGSGRGLGRDLSVRPYFRRAMAGTPNLYPAVGKNTGERGIYLAAPVRGQLDPQAEPVGVAVVKIGMERIDAQLGRYAHTALLVSPEGVVFGGNRSQWLLHTLAPIGAADRAQLARDERYGDLFAKGVPPALPLALGVGGERLDGERVERAFTTLDWPAARRDWQLVVLRPLTPAEQGGTALAAAVAALAASLGLAAAGLRRRARQARRAWEHGQAEAAVARELAFQQRLIDALPNPLFLKDAEGRYTTLNQAFEAAYGVRREDIIGRTVLELPLLDANTREEAHRRDMEVVHSGGRIQHALESHWADGRVHQTLFWGQGLRALDGGTAGMVGVLLDISEEAQARAALRERERLLRDLLESAPGAVVAADGSGGVLFHNRNALEMFGVDAATLAAQGMQARYADPSQRAALMEHLWRDGFARASELEMVRGDGDRFWAQLSFTRGSFGGQPDVAFGWCVDITERKRTAQAMQAARDAAEAAVAARSDFLANMSHEIRTPLNTIIGQAHLALQGELSASQRVHVHKVHGAAQALLAIANDVLDFSQTESGRLVLQEADFDLDALLARLASRHGPQADDKGLALRLDVDEAVPRQLCGDVQRLEQVLGQLLGNALKFTAQGEVVLQCGYRPTESGGVVLEIAVRDTGIGIAPEQLGPLFQPFRQVDGSSTRRFGGIGLGLALCKRLADAAGGAIAAQSALGAGTCIRLAWPCRAGSGRCQPEAAPAPAASAWTSGGVAALTDAQARSGLALLCEMLESMDGSTGTQLQAMRPWLQLQLPPAQLHKLVRLVQHYDLEDALALLRGSPALAPWLPEAA